MKGFISLLFKKHKKEKEVPKIESHEKEPALQKDSQSAHPEEKRTLLKSADHQGVAAKPQKSPEETIKEEMYQYMNRGVQMMFSLYGTDRWSELSLFGEISQDLYENYEEVLQTLSKPSGKLAGDFFSCLVFSKEEGKIIGKTEDPEKMKPVFFEYMMPFYPMYFRQLKEGGLRHNSLYSVEALSLFHELTGKKFRPGYRNRYKTGVRALNGIKTGIKYIKTMQSCFVMRFLKRERSNLVTARAGKQILCIRTGRLSVKESGYREFSKMGSQDMNIR